MNLNYTEENLIGNRVIFIKDIDYGTFIIEKDTTGTIVDFGKTSGDPLIKWDFSELKTFAKLSTHVLLLKDISNYTTVK